MSYRIVAKKELAPDVKLMVIDAPLVAGHCLPGQFVVLRIDEKGERIPLTIYDFDSQEGTISIIFHEIGKSTKQLGLMSEGDSVLDFAGPLGKPFPVGKYGTVACVGGGLGIAPVYPIARALKDSGNKVLSVIGARSKDLLILENELGTISDSVYTATDDGSYGRKGLVTNVLEDLLKEETIDLVVAIGPVPMMKAVSELTRGKVKTLVSLNPIMVDGTGMCGACRVTVGNQVKFACVDGPDFDGHKVDFDELAMKNRLYLEEEKRSLQDYECRCKAERGGGGA